MLEHFSLEELQCPLTKKVMLAHGFGEKLEKLRIEFGYPMKVNSCCRSTEYNKMVNGVKGSFHIFDNELGTCAIDVSTCKMNKTLREKLIFIATKQGWSVGFGTNFLHLDRRVDYTIREQICFYYGKKIK